MGGANSGSTPVDGSTPASVALPRSHPDHPDYESYLDERVPDAYLDEHCEMQADLLRGITWRDFNELQAQPY